MKNIIWAVVAFIIILVAIFVFTKQDEINRDNIGDETSSSESIISDNVNKDSTSSATKGPFEVLRAEDIVEQKVRLETSKGDIVIELFSDSPLASSNFIELINKKFYNGLTFHRREEGFVIQGGDPKGNGTGGPGYKFDDEPVTRNYTKGIVAMANSGPNTNGSQFFIMLDDNTSLPKQYTIFGNVIEGIEVVDSIAVGDIIKNASIE